MCLCVLSITKHTFISRVARRSFERFYGRNKEDGKVEKYHSWLAQRTGHGIDARMQFVDGEIHGLERGQQTG